jgi:hypothetical protein
MMGHGRRRAEADVACGRWRPHHARLLFKIAFSIRLLLLVPTREIFFYPPDLQLFTFTAEERATPTIKLLELLKTFTIQQRSFF